MPTKKQPPLARELFFEVLEPATSSTVSSASAARCALFAETIAAEYRLAIHGLERNGAFVAALGACDFMLFARCAISHSTALLSILKH
jgi:hypothetical protein